MRGKVTFVGSDGATTTVEIENDFTVDDVARLAGAISGKLSLNGEPAEGDEPVEDEDIVEEHKSAKGN